MVNPASPPTTPPINAGLEAPVPSPSDSPPEAAVPDGGLALLVSVGSPEPPPPPIPPDEEAVGKSDEEVSDRCVDIDVRNDEAVDLGRIGVKEV